MRPSELQKPQGQPSWKAFPGNFDCDFPIRVYASFVLVTTAFASQPCVRFSTLMGKTANNDPVLRTVKIKTAENERCDVMMT